MSTYSYLLCEQCSDTTDFVSRGDIFTWMADAVTEVPKFLASHADHLSAIRLISESDYDDWFDHRHRREEYR